MSDERYSSMISIGGSQISGGSYGGSFGQGGEGSGGIHIGEKSSSIAFSFTEKPYSNDWQFFTLAICD